MQRVVRSVHEDRFLAAVAVDVDEASDWVGLASVTHDIRAELFDRVDGGMQLRIGIQELSIQVVT